MTTTPQPHVHADKIVQYAKDTTQSVWIRDGSTRWEKLALVPGTFPSFRPNAEWHVGHEPPQEPERMKLVFEGNAPWRVEPPEGTIYYCISEFGPVAMATWCGTGTDKEFLAAGNCWKTEADAIAYRDAYRAAALETAK